MSSGKPRLLVEPSDTVLHNIGDMAMLYCGTKRLAAALPTAAIEVLTWEPDKLADLCPHARPIGADGRSVWLALLPRRIARSLPVSWSIRFRLAACRLLARLLGSSSSRRGAAIRKAAAFVETVETADALVVAGMGGLTDYFPEWAYEMLETMALALRLGRPVILVGQGIGPIESRWLRRRAAAILPEVELIGLREGRASLPALLELGVDRDRIVVTGDDALQLGFQLRVEQSGKALGLNIRIADYSAMGIGDAERVAKLVSEEADARHAPIVALPISLPISTLPYSADVDSLLKVLPDRATDFARASNIESPADFVREAQRCRIVVAGSYHAAVFALSAGIPVVGLARSTYYVDKFAGLAELFGEGCAWVDLREEKAPPELREQIARLWDNADDLRGGLLAAAQSHIAAGDAFYERIAGMIMPSEANA